MCYVSNNRTAKEVYIYICTGLSTTRRQLGLKLINSVVFSAKAYILPDRSFIHIEPSSLTRVESSHLFAFSRFDGVCALFLRGSKLLCESVYVLFSVQLNKFGTETWIVSKRNSFVHASESTFEYKILIFILRKSYRLYIYLFLISRLIQRVHLNSKWICYTSLCKKKNFIFIYDHSYRSKKN